MDAILLVFVIIYYQVMYSPKITSLGLNIQYLGVLDVINLLLMSGMLLILPRVIFKNDFRNIAVYTLLPAISFLIFGLTSQLFSAIVTGVFFDLAWSARRYILPTITNKYFNSTNRALGLSSLSFISGLIAALLVPLVIAIVTQNFMFTLIPVLLLMVILALYRKN
jgi:hypothetical protein